MLRLDRVGVASKRGVASDHSKCVGKGVELLVLASPGKVVDGHSSMLNGSKAAILVLIVLATVKQQVVPKDW